MDGLPTVDDKNLSKAASDLLHSKGSSIVISLPRYQHSNVCKCDQCNVRQYWQYYRF